jgi:prenyltransferase beta subunit
VVKTLKAGQRKDGGFGKADAAGSDLETCYRVMRCFVMLKEKPADVAGLRKFVARCRNADGGYGIAPGQPSGAGPTYFASIVLHWLEGK